MNDATRRTTKLKAAVRAAAAAAVLILAASACTRSGGRDAAPEGREANTAASAEARAFDWKAEKGASLHILACDHPWVQYAESRLDEFCTLTGIKVRIETYPEDQFRVKRSLEMLSGISDVDVFMIMPGNSMSEYYVRGWVEPLDSMIRDQTIAWPELDADDFYPSALDSGVRGGRQFSIPILLETSILAYNKRIFAEYGITVPRTMRELEAAARDVYRKSEGRIYGITMRGYGATATSQWCDFLHSFGGRWLRDEGMSALNSREAAESLEFYGRLLREYGPPDAIRNGWYESLSVFMRGEAAMIYDGNVFRSRYEDPRQSRVFKDVGYAMLPAGPAGSIPHISNWGLSIYSGSVEKRAAWLFIQWAASKEMSLAAHLEGIPSARKSVWNDRRFLDRDPAPEWTAASVKSYEAATFLWNPPVIRVEDAREVVGSAVSAAITGQDAAAAAKRASEELDAIIRGEYGDWPGNER